MNRADALMLITLAIAAIFGILREVFDQGEEMRRQQRLADACSTQLTQVLARQRVCR